MCRYRYLCAEKRVFDSPDFSIFEHLCEFVSLGIWEGLLATLRQLPDRCGPLADFADSCARDACLIQGSTDGPGVSG